MAYSVAASQTVQVDVPSSSARRPGRYPLPFMRLIIHFSVRVVSSLRAIPRRSHGQRTETAELDVLRGQSRTSPEER